MLLRDNAVTEGGRVPSVVRCCVSRVLTEVTEEDRFQAKGIASSKAQESSGVSSLEELQGGENGRTGGQ